MNNQLVYLYVIGGALMAQGHTLTSVYGLSWFTGIEMLFGAGLIVLGLYSEDGKRKNSKKSKKTL